MPTTLPVLIWGEEPTTIKDFNHFIQLMQEYKIKFLKKLLLFRGQNCDKPLLPKLGRPDVTEHVSDLKSFEDGLFADFKKRYQAYSKKEFSNDWDLMALAQHYKLPTRLLDWSASALIALWFATEDSGKVQPGVVWLFSPEEQHVITAEEKQSNPYLHKLTKVFCPDHISERITAQQGWFTWHIITTKDNIKELEHHSRYKHRLKKLVIPHKLFGEMHVMLEVMGVNASTVFPDLEGLSRYLAWKNLKVDHEQLEFEKDWNDAF